MDLCRITDFDTVRSMLTSPEVYPSIGDDYTPPVEEFKVNEHPHIWYVGVHNASWLWLGMFTLLPQNRVCWEVHAVMMPWAKTAEKWAAARILPDWLAAYTPCKRLTATVPSSNWPALVYGTHGIGMRYVGRQPAAFMKGGKLQDLIILGRSIGS
jgi:hypothetical protein